MIHRRHEASPRRGRRAARRGTKKTRREPKDEKERRTQGDTETRSTRKCRRHCVGRGNYVFRESTELHYREVMDRRIAEMQVRRVRERGVISIPSLLPFFPSLLHFRSARTMEAARKREKEKKRAGGRKRRVRGDVAKRRRHDANEINCAM